MLKTLCLENKGNKNCSMGICLTTSVGIPRWAMPTSMVKRDSLVEWINNYNLASFMTLTKETINVNNTSQGLGDKGKSMYHEIQVRVTYK